MLYDCQPEKMKPDVGVKIPGGAAANVNIGMSLVSTKNLAKMGSKVFTTPVCFVFFFVVVVS